MADDKYVRAGSQRQAGQVREVRATFVRGGGAERLTGIMRGVLLIMGTGDQTISMYPGDT